MFLTSNWNCLLVLATIKCTSPYFLLLYGHSFLHLGRDQREIAVNSEVVAFYLLSLKAYIQSKQLLPASGKGECELIDIKKMLFKLSIKIVLVFSQLY